MIIQKNFINKLRDFGLNSYESKLWTALLSRGISTAGELSDIANVPRSRTYDVLESLEKKGFIIMKVGKPIKYIAVHPEEVLKRVKKKIQEDAVIRTGLMEQLEASEVLAELTSLHNKGITLTEPGDMTGAFKGRPNVYEHLISLIRKAKNSVTIITSNSGLERKSEILIHAMSKAKARGIKIKVGVYNLAKNNKALAAMQKVAEVKPCEVKGRFVVVDEEDVTFMLMDDAESPEDHNDIGIWIKSPFFASMMQKIAEQQMK